MNIGDLKLTEDEIRGIIEAVLPGQVRSEEVADAATAKALWGLKDWLWACAAPVSPGITGGREDWHLAPAPNHVMTELAAASAQLNLYLDAAGIPRPEAVAK